MAIRNAALLLLGITALLSCEVDLSASSSPTTSLPSTTHSSPCSTLYSFPITNSLELKITIPSNNWREEIDPRLDEDSFKYVPLNRVIGSSYFEKIIVDTQVGSGYSARKFHENVLSHIMRNYPMHKVLEASVEESDDHHTTAKLIVVYYLPENQHNQLLYFEYHSGPKSCSGIQYSIVLSQKIPIDTALAKVLVFSEANVAAETISERRSFP